MDSSAAGAQPSRFEKPTPVSAACRNEVITAVAAGVVVMVVFLLMRPPVICPDGGVHWMRLLVVGTLAGAIAYFGPAMWSAAQGAFARST
jgi:hypothetical protein